jgi:hypothetical protein
MSCIAFEGKSRFLHTETYADTPTSYRAQFQNGTDTIRLDTDRISPDNAVAELHAAVTRFSGLYEKAPAPYPGEISDAVVCDPAFVPERKTIMSPAGLITYYIGYLNNRMTFGSCSMDQAVYRGITAYFYCSDTRLLIHLELISPKDSFKEAEGLQRLSSLSCSR